MRTLLIIGIGAGSKQHLTLEAIAALQQADAVLALDKGTAKADLLQLRQQLITEHAPGLPLVAVSDPERDRNPTDYASEVQRWHRARAEVLFNALDSHIPVNGTAAFLVWGDPSLYDSTLRVIANMQKFCGLECTVRVVPGITAIQVLTAAHGIVLNRIGEDIHIATARNLPATSVAERRNCVVMLDGGAAWLDAHTERTYIWWGAFLGTPHQVLRAGWVIEIGQELKELKAQLRAKHGWVMDTYLLRELD